MDVVKSLGKCMAGVGVLLRVGRAEAVFGGGDTVIVQNKLDNARVKVARVEAMSDMEAFYLNSEIYVVIVTLIAMIIGAVFLLNRSRLNCATQCRSELKDQLTPRIITVVDQGTEYYLRDACADARTRKLLASEYLKFFHDMTVEGAREYLRARGVLGGGQLKSEVVNRRVQVRMIEVMTGRVTSKIRGWHPD